jgi:Fic family protein
MDLEALTKSPVGRLVPISGIDAKWGPFSSFAFVPDPLPSSVPLTEPTVRAVIDAGLALGRLDMAAGRVPNPALLVRPALRKEAQSTSALEGTYAPITEVLEGEIVGAEGLRAETREILNYVAAAEAGVQTLVERPISLNMLADLQGILVKGTRGETYDAGRLRERQVLIGPRNEPIERARFIPTPAGELLKDGVSDWERWIHDEGDTHVLVKVTLGHYQFETLHPFADGNGRLGRLIMTLQLIEAGVLKYPLLNIAEWLEPRKDDYVGRLWATSVTGDFDSWVAFLCEGIKEQSDAAVDRIDRLVAVRDDVLETVFAAGSRRGGATYRIADEVIGYPIIDVPSAAARQGVTYQSANEAIKRLVSIGVLREVRRSGRTRKIFLSDAVLNELSR